MTAMTRPKVMETPTCVTCPREMASMTMAPQPAKTRANVPTISARYGPSRSPMRSRLCICRVHRMLFTLEPLDDGEEIPNASCQLPEDKIELLRLLRRIDAGGI